MKLAHVGRGHHAWGDRCSLAPREPKPAKSHHHQQVTQHQPLSSASAQGAETALEIGLSWTQAALYSLIN